MKLYTFGCSFTEGQGLEYQSFDCYTTKLAEKLNLEYLNFGSSGMSNDYIFRKIFELINSNIIQRDDILVIQWTHYLRKELSTIVDNRLWYHTIPNSFHAYQDKVIMQIDKNISVQNEYYNQNLDKERLKIESKNKKFLDKYILDFINKDYQKNTTINYINALYAYLEYNGYKHLHFFGWDSCVIKSVIEEKSKFLKENFGTHTATSTSNYTTEHPNKAGHKMWADFLYDKIIELKYNNEFQAQLNSYIENLYKLKYQIEQDIENSNNRLIKEKQLELDGEIEKLKEESKIELEKESIKLNSLKEKIKEEIRIEQLKLESIIKNKPKSLI
jgi:hypothetical protein